MNDLGSDKPPAAESGETGLPMLRTWRGVYFCVLGVFVTYVVLLSVLTQAFS
jgi:hypothetical protein